MRRPYAAGAVLSGSEAAVGSEATVAAHSAMTEVTNLSHSKFLRSTQLCWHQSVMAPGYAAWGYKAILTAFHFWP